MAVFCNDLRENNAYLINFEPKLTFIKYPTEY